MTTEPFLGPQKLVLDPSLFPSKMSAHISDRILIRSFCNGNDDKLAKTPPLRSKKIVLEAGLPFPLCLLGVRSVSMPKRNLFFIIFVVFAGMLAWLARDHGGHGRRFAEVLATVEQRYVEPVNGEQMFAAAMNGLFSSLDEHSSFISGTLKEDLNISLDQEFGGVGLELATRDNLIEVQSPIVRSPAWSAGIVAGDIIESIDGRSTAGWSLSEVVAALRGTPGTVVTLGLSSVKTDPTLRTLDPTAIIPSVNEKTNVS